MRNNNKYINKKDLGDECEKGQGDGPPARTQQQTRLVCYKEPTIDAVLFGIFFFFKGVTDSEHELPGHQLYV